MARALPYVVADVFCDAALQGNPVAVFTDAGELKTETMQALARELNLSETVFLVGDVPAGADVRARIFTPATELPFAGHPVLGTAFVVARQHGTDAVAIATGSGIVPVRLRRDGERIVSGEMDQPIPTWAPYAESDALLAALRVPGSQLPVEVYDNGPHHTYVMLGSAEEVAAVAPRHGRTRCARRGRGQLLLRRGAPRCARGCSAPASVWPRIRRPGRPPDRSRSISGATGWRRSAPA